MQMHWGHLATGAWATFIHLFSMFILVNETYAMTPFAQRVATDEMGFYGRVKERLASLADETR